MSEGDHNAELQLSFLPAPSRQKSMDWSLVLASQDIPHWIASTDESGKWRLQVASADVSRASTAIRQFEAENRTRPWQKHYLGGRIIFDWVAVVWVVGLVMIHVLSERSPAIGEIGCMHGTKVMMGEWWRLVTATQLHADWSHLASNICIGVVLLGLVMGRWGAAVGTLAAMLAGVGGNLTILLLQPERQSLGASTVVMGCIGLLALTPRTSNTTSPHLWQGVLGGIAGAVMLFMLHGLDPRTDVLAHAGGFVSGLALAATLRAIPALMRAKATPYVATLLLAVLVLATWTAAMHHESPTGTPPKLGLS
ncbi:MAG: hypothetical protein RLY20_1172 [Verrucomicrobiota bacterium]|jgi:membrane associated rhomboid family serine protease